VGLFQNETLQNSTTFNSPATIPIIQPTVSDAFNFLFNWTIFPQLTRSGVNFLNFTISKTLYSPDTIQIFQKSVMAMQNTVPAMLQLLTKAALLPPIAMKSGLCRL